MTAHPDAPASPPVGRQRWGRVGRNAAALAATRVVSGLCQLALVPLVLGHFGADLFGWITALVALVAMAHFADLGVAIALQQELSEAWARQDHAALRRIYASGSRLLALIGAAWLVVALPAAGWLGPRLLAAPGLAPPGSPHLIWLIVVGLTLLGVPFSAGLRLAAATQQAWIAAGWTAATNVAVVALVWLVTQTTGPAAPLLVVTLLCAAQVVPGALAAVHLRSQLGWFGPGAATAPEMRRLWHEGRPFAVPNLIGALLQTLTPSAFAWFGGYSASAAFAILQRLFGMVQQSHQLLLGPLWPAYAEAAVRGERAWVAHSFRVSLALTAATAALVAGLTALLPWLTPFWLGPAAPVPGPALAWLVGGWAIASLFSQALSFLLLGLGRLKLIAGSLALTHLATLAGMLVGGKFFGTFGVATALAVGSLCSTLPLLACATRAALHALAAPTAAR